MKIQYHIIHPDHDRIPSGFPKVVSDVLKHLKRHNDQISIILCDDSCIKKLHRKFLNKNTATDVLSFNLSDPQAKNVTAEIYINLDRTRKQALGFGVTFWNELTRLTVHGLLHLYGFDDQNAIDKKVMIDTQEKIVSQCTHPLHW